MVWFVCYQAAIDFEDCWEVANGWAKLFLHVTKKETSWARSHFCNMTCHNLESFSVSPLNLFFQNKSICFFPSSMDGWVIDCVVSPFHASRWNETRIHNLFISLELKFYIFNLFSCCWRSSTIIKSEGISLPCTNKTSFRQQHQIYGHYYELVRDFFFFYYYYYSWFSSNHSRGIYFSTIVLQIVVKEADIKRVQLWVERIEQVL